ncbi:MAG: hypothetical protein ABW086_09255 [Sedimenticola sp.]
MLAIIIIGLFLLYIVIFVTVVRMGMDEAESRGKARWKGGLIGGLIVYLPVFWDHIPTYLVHQYYCLTEVDFQIYKTPEQWKAENPGVAETLTWKNEPSPDYIVDGVVVGDIINERFVYVLEQKSPLFLPVTVSYDKIIDVNTSEVMAESVRVGSGYGQFSVGGKGSWKYWIDFESCFPEEIDDETI